MSKVLPGSTAVVGIGQTEFSKAAGRSETQLASDVVAALADAGLSVADVDGLVSYTIDQSARRLVGDWASESASPAASPTAAGIQGSCCGRAACLWASPTSLSPTTP
jgi:acetyl-CoA acetyltransferase